MTSVGFYNFDGGFSCHFVDPHHPYRSICGISYMPVKSYLKWWEIQLAIHSTVGPQVDYE